MKTKRQGDGKVAGAGEAGKGRRLPEEETSRWVRLVKEKKGKTKGCFQVGLGGKRGKGGQLSYRGRDESEKGNQVLPKEQGM